MRNLLQFFLRFGAFFLFLFLEVASFYMVVRFNQKQKSIYIHSSNEWVAKVNEWVDGVVTYFYLTDAINELREENAHMRTALKRAGFSDKVVNDSLEFIVQDTANQDYTFIAADIISKTVLGNYNKFTLNRGRKDGIGPHMGVISSKGVIGIITNVSRKYASVMTILHRESRINVANKRTGNFGPLVWRSTDPRILNLEDIPRHASLQIGDTIETSGYSNIFPKGIMVGTISEFTVDEGDTNYEIKVMLTNDLSNLQSAYIINNRNKNELSELEEN